jgi:hypothetical protein
MEIGDINTSGGHIYDIVGNEWDGGNASPTNRQSFTFVAVLSYSCDCEPEPDLFWFINRQDAHPRFTPDPQQRGLMQAFMAATTYRSPQNDHGGFDVDRYGRKTPVENGGSGICQISAADNPTINASFIVVGRVTWSTPRGVVRCIKMKKITIVGRRLMSNRPPSRTEEADIMSQVSALR